MITFDWIITNGYMDEETINKRIENGWSFVIELPAKRIHPYALETDRIAIFSKYKNV